MSDPERRAPLGPALRDDDEALARAAEITPEDVAQAAEKVRETSPDLARLLDAEEEGAAGEEP